jgi:hypothetical protein
VAEELEWRLARLFLPDAAGRRPSNGDRALNTSDPHFRDLVLFYEYFHGEDGRGLGASHQTGWTALEANILERVAAARSRLHPSMHENAAHLRRGHTVEEETAACSGRAHASSSTRMRRPSSSVSGCSPSKTKE